MAVDDTKENGCPLVNQTGRDAIKDFDTILNRMSPDQRRAFERERAECIADRTEHTKHRYGFRV